MKRKIDRVMDKPITAMVLMIIITMFMMLAVACNQPIEENEGEPIKHQEICTYKVVPLVVIHDDEETTAEETSLVPAPSDAPMGEGVQMTLKAYAYCPCAECCGKTDGITATGTQATPNRTIAVDKSVIPYGSKVVIDGNVYIAEDCGGAIKGNRIDILFDTHQEALAFGVQYAEVSYIAKEVR